MSYDSLKLLHIASATLVLTSIAYCFYLWKLIPKTRNALSLSDRIQSQTWLVIIPFSIVQMASGFTLISLKHYNFSEMWIAGSIISFITVMAGWFAFVYYLLLSQQAPISFTSHAQLKFYRQIQSLMLSLCALALLSMIFFMANKITSIYG
jgi:uncharacterized membrane protein